MTIEEPKEVIIDPKDIIDIERGRQYVKDQFILITIIVILCILLLGLAYQLNTWENSCNKHWVKVLNGCQCFGDYGDPQPTYNISERIWIKGEGDG
jgi:hypothetical protein